MFGDAWEGLVDCTVLMGAGVTSTVGVMAVDCQYHVLLGRFGMQFGQSIASVKLGCSIWLYTDG